MDCEEQPGPGSAHRWLQAACGSVPWGRLVAPALGLAGADPAGILSKPGCDEGRARGAAERVGVSWAPERSRSGCRTPNCSGVTGGSELGAKGSRCVWRVRVWRERCAEEQDVGALQRLGGTGDSPPGVPRAGGSAPGQEVGAAAAGELRAGDGAGWDGAGWDEPRGLCPLCRGRSRALPVLSCGASPTAPVPGCRAASEQLRLLNMQQVLYSEKFRRNFFVLACKCG